MSDVRSPWCGLSIACSISTMIRGLTHYRFENHYESHRRFSRIPLPHPYFSIFLSRLGSQTKSNFSNTEGADQRQQHSQQHPPSPSVEDALDEEYHPNVFTAAQEHGTIPQEGASTQGQDNVKIKQKTVKDACRQDICSWINSTSQGQQHKR